MKPNPNTLDSRVRGSTKGKRIGRQSIGRKPRELGQNERTSQSQDQVLLKSPSGAINCTWNILGKNSKKRANAGPCSDDRFRTPVLAPWRPGLDFIDVNTLVVPRSIGSIRTIATATPTLQASHQPHQSTLFQCNRGA